jgi:hypothetical protein
MIAAAVSLLALVGCTAMPAPDAAEAPSPSASASASASSSTQRVVTADVTLADPPAYTPTDFDALLASDTLSESTGVADVTSYDEIQREWERVTSAWPLPVPESLPFPVRVDEIPHGTTYSVGYALYEADRWWTCAAATAALDARAGGDATTAAYWLEALRLWWSSDAKADIFANPETYISDVIDPAAEGDWAKLEQQSGCEPA